MIVARTVLVLLLAMMLSGCAGVRYSYESALDKRYSKPVMELKVGEEKEVLCVGGGFPGWWGIYPGIVSADAEVASIFCKYGRGLIPFREPGVLFGGTTCHVKAHKVGAVWLLQGDDPGLSVDHEPKLPAITDESHFPPDPAGFHSRWILLKVVRPQ